MAITKTTKSTKTTLKKADAATEKLKKENSLLKDRVAELEKKVKALESAPAPTPVSGLDPEVVKRALGPSMARHPIVDAEVRASGLKALLWG